MTTPLFSVIVPLEYHRGQWERCLRGWQAQTLPKSDYELILVVPPDFPEQAKLPVLLGPQDRLEYSAQCHDMGLCAAGAARARGRFLFFTELHCWPEPDVLEKCLQAFAAHPEWAAFSCRSMRVTHNRLSNAEADMYEADIENGLKNHPWRKVLDQCFVTRRDSFEQCGGLKFELGHFAEWVLAANYHALGYTIGYVPEARLYHYYIGQLAELRAFTRDFITGEMRYVAKESREPGRDLLEVPAEWICQGNWDRRLARNLLWITIREMTDPSASHSRRPRISARTLLRWLAAAILGEDAARAKAALKVCGALAGAKLAGLVGSNARLGAAFKNYVAALIHHQRFECVRSARRARAMTAGGREGGPRSGWNVFAPENFGFYPIENSQGTRFRWSATAAILPARMPAGRHRVCIECLPVRSLAHATDLRLYFNGRRLSSRDVSIGPNTIEIRLDLARSCHATLAWTCLPFATAGARRWLGLPVERIVWNGGPESPALKTAARAEG